uniref:Hyaluronidase n=1 Tax=Jaculus jaculus TaxID=51337 RepID=A0A8C5P4Y2_JACJA
MGLLSFLESLVESSGVYQAVLVFLLIPWCMTQDVRESPVIPNTPFLWAWNVPSDICTTSFNDSVDLKIFSLIGSPRQTAKGRGVIIFYTDRLGYYPHIDHSQRIVHGGVPQAGSLQDHLNKARTDIEKYIPVDDLGMAVIDWEDWRPTWLRNWKPKDNYRNKSIEIVQQRNPQLSFADASKLAKEEFERAGRSFMEETLKLGVSLRPKRLWGYYLFPDCYNNKFNDPNYNGFCPDVEKKRNDALGWMWNESTALYPSIYLKYDLKSNRQAALYVRSRVQEAIRVSRVRDPRNPIPVFVYTRLAFTDITSEYLGQEDLVNTIGETIAVGASGMVVWATANLARSLAACAKLHDYMTTTFTPYLINATLAYKMCNQVLCDDEGVCVRKDWNSDDYLHLSPQSFNIEYMKDGIFRVNGAPSYKDLEYFADKFYCRCFANRTCKTNNDGMNSVRYINVCTPGGVCIQTEPNPAFYLTLDKSLLLLTALIHALQHGSQYLHIFLGMTSVDAS